MRCIFCKIDSASSRSIEHIIPESLWNRTHVLPAGVVCDKCNNYFSREVEKPFLESAPVRRLRFEQAIPNKHGRVPPTTALILPDIPTILTRPPFGRSGMSAEVPPGSIERIARSEQLKLAVPASEAAPPGRVVSRFLAKAALEAMADRLVAVPDGLEYLVDETQLDPIRNYARRGEPIHDWPYYVRRIHAADRIFIGCAGGYEQTVHEYDIFKTDWNEWFFVMAIFGLELTINYGGPETEGYVRWLSANGNVSPLYSGKNVP
ncbi:MAG: HNH endonuclease [Spirochaetia bacterium]